MNFALEKLRQVDWLVIKIKQVPFLLFSCSSLFQWRGSRPHFLFLHSAWQISKHCFCFSEIPWQTILLIFSAPSLAYIKIRFFSFLISSMDFEKATSYFSTSRQALLFHRIMFTASNLLFSSRISFTVINFSSFRNEFFFRLLPSQKAITRRSGVFLSLWAIAIQALKISVWSYWLSDFR